MSEPIWLRSAALSASLAGIDPAEAVRGFADDDARAIGARMAVLANVARTVGWARTAVEEREGAEVRTGDEPARVRIGARVVACWLRAMEPTDRARWVRAFDPETLRLARDATDAPPTQPVDARALSALVARAAEALGRAPSALELGALVQAVHGDDRAVPARIAALARSARILGLGWREATQSFFGAEVQP